MKGTENFGDAITILENPTNLGGSGGFGRGVRTALEMGYKYLMLVDNDAMLDEKALEHLYSYMETHTDVGICGAETLNLQYPDKIQDLGGRIDYNCYNWGGIIGGFTELAGNAILEADYVASCSVLARVEYVRKFGGFPEENFIYWDDIEWCTRCRLAGYKVVVNGNAKAYHDLSGAKASNMFLCYYANRNRYRYFTKFLPEERLEDFYQVITRELFTKIYGAKAKGKHGTVQTSLNAFEDFVYGKTGKAEEGKLVPYVLGEDRLAENVASANSILIYMPTHTWEDYNYIHRIFNYIMRLNKDCKIVVTYQPEDYVNETFDLRLQLCDHVTKVTENVLPWIYVDPFFNYVMDENDFSYFSCFEEELMKFQNKYRMQFEDRIRELRQ